MTEASTASPQIGASQQIDLRPGADVDANARLLTSIIYGLYLAGFVTGGLTAIAGVIMAYVVSRNAPAWAKTHYTFQIWTFWLTLIVVLLFVPFLIAWFVTGAILSLVLIGIPMLVFGVLLIFAPFVWFVARCAVGLSY